ncbi:MAG: MotA/TolQ/ExbB proton channel family protein [Planctomycetota bacterium]
MITSIPSLVAAPPPGWSLAAADAAGPTSWLQTIQNGGPVAFVILVLSVAAMALVVMHLWQIRRGHLLPPEDVATVERMLAEGRVADTLEFCLDPAHDSYFTRIVAAGLTRFQQSAFGVFEVKDAVEEAGEDQTARLYRSTDALGVIGSIAPLLGLFGTVLGMVGAFESLSRSAATQSEALAANISVALVTTLLGLALAIPCVALFTFFRNRIDAFASETSIAVERALLHLESAQAGGGQKPAAAAAARPRPVAGGPSA